MDLDNLNKIKDSPVEQYKEKNGLGFTQFISYYAFELEPQFDKEPDMIDKIYEKTLKWFLEKKNGYYGYKWDENTYHILRKENMDFFQLSKEEHNLVLYPFDRCSEKTIKDFCRQINDDIFDVRVNKYSSTPVDGF